VNCRLVEAKLSQFLDQELSGREMMAIRHHCGQCGACASELSALSKVKSMLGSSTVVEPPLGFEDRLHTAVFAGATARPRPARFPFRSALVAAVAGAVLVVGVMQVIEPKDANVPIASNTESIDYETDQAVQGMMDPFGGQPIVTVSHGR